MTGLLPGWDAVPDPDGGSDVYYWNKVIPLQTPLGPTSSLGMGTVLLSRWASRCNFFLE